MYIKCAALLFQIVVVMTLLSLVACGTSRQEKFLGVWVSVEGENAQCADFLTIKEEKSTYIVTMVSPLGELEKYSVAYEDGIMKG